MTPRGGFVTALSEIPISYPDPYRLNMIAQNFALGFKDTRDKGDIGAKQGVPAYNKRTVDVNHKIPLSVAGLKQKNDSMAKPKDKTELNRVAGLFIKL